MHFRRLENHGIILECLGNPGSFFNDNIGFINDYFKFWAIKQWYYKVYNSNQCMAQQIKDYPEKVWDCCDPGGVTDFWVEVKVFKIDTHTWANISEDSAEGKQLLKSYLFLAFIFFGKYRILIST